MEKNNPRVLIAGYEVVPFYKRGGLGDVLGSLPIALSNLEVDARVVMPYYRSVREKFPQKEIGSFSVVFDKKEEDVQILQGTIPDSKVPIYFLANHKLISIINLSRKRIEEFVFFDVAITGFINWLEDQGEFIPDIVHCNDWHTALVPLLLQRRMKSSIKTLLTIHNLAYQGRGSLRALDQASIEDKELKILTKKNPVTELNALGEGIVHAGKISTVSPQYAKEISQIRTRTKIYRYLHLREKNLGRSDRLIGILNGIDTQIWNPQEDNFISRKYNIENIESGKNKNKEILLKDLRLAQNKPTFAFIGRVATQKGIDLILEKAKEIVDLDINLIILGSGLKPLEKKVRALAEKYKDNIRAEVIFKEELAHKLYAGSDFMLMPSHYEPCGLVQMASMRYGTIPVASRTGGLIDTIEDGKTGFLFENGSSTSMINAIKRAIKVYQDQEKLHRMRRAAMKKDFSWEKNAKLYKELYRSMIDSSE